MNRPESAEKLTAHATPHHGEIAHVRLTHKQIRAIYFGLVLSMFLSALNQTIVATALPTIGRSFGEIGNLSWIITAYLLTSTAVSPLYGKLSDIHGRRAVMLAAVGVFIAGSIAAAAAQNMPMLILGRALQGLGGGGLVPLVQTTIADIVSPRERGRYQAYMAVVWITAGVLGPVLGGLIADYIHWSAIFWLNVPLGLIAALLTHKQLKMLPRHDRKHKLDMLGAGLMMASAVAMLLVLTWGGTHYPWFSLPIVALVVLSGLLAFGFSWRITHVDEPFLPLGLLRNPVMLVGTASNSLAFAAQLSMTVFLPLYYQMVHQLSATEAGLMLIPSVVLTTPSSVIAGRVMMHFARYKWFATGGMIIAVCGMGLLTIRPDLPLHVVVAILSVISVGVGTMFPIATVSIQNAVPRHQVGTATGTVNFFRQLMAAFLIAVMGAILLAGLGVSAGRGTGIQVFSAGLGASAAPAEVFRWVFGSAEIFLIVALVLWVMMEERPLAGSDDPLQVTSSAS